MQHSRLKNYLEVITNVAVLLVAVVVLGTFAWRYFASEQNSPLQKSLQNGETFGQLTGINFADSPQTLVIALSSRCGFCTQSMPFYKQLTEIQRENKKTTRVIAIFSEEEEEVKPYIEQHQLYVDTLSNIDFKTLKVSSTPTIILVDTGGTIIDFWVGRLSKDTEQRVLTAINAPNNATQAQNNAASEPKKTVDLFDEKIPRLVLRPNSESQNERAEFVDCFDVDDQGYIYLAINDSLAKYSPDGRLIGSIPLASNEKAIICVDAEGNLYVPSEKGFSIYSSSLEKSREIPLPSIFTSNAFVLKTAFDRKHNCLYIQVYDRERWSQTLYKFNPDTLDLRTIFQLGKPVSFTPFHGPGAFDFTIGTKHLYVSDIYEYRVFVYSLSSNSLLKTLSKPFNTKPVAAKDGYLTHRKVTLGGLGGPGLLKDYPPIFHLNSTSTGHLLVWTSQRNHEFKQVVHVYDAQLNFKGTDLKYMHPGRSNYIFANGKVYVPDFGFGRDITLRTLSPLEVPNKPLTLVVFDDLSSKINQRLSSL